MTTKRLLTLAVLLPFLAMSTMAYAGAKASAPSKGQKYDTAGRAMDTSWQNRNDVIHRYRGGPKYPH
jgi:hypothetical protein